MSRNFLIFDANVFLNLAKTPGNLEVLKSIEKLVRKEKRFELIIPEPVITAVEAHKDGAVKSHWELRRNTAKNMKRYLQDLAKDAEAFKNTAQDITEKIHKAESKVPESFLAMSNLIAAGSIETCSAENYMFAGKRFLEKKAPAHLRTGKQREHTAIFKDCLIWEVVKSYALIGNVEFVSEDGDFVDLAHNQKLHIDLAEEVKNLSVTFHNLNSFLDAYVKEAPEVVPPPEVHNPGEYFPHYKTCPMCGSSNIGAALIPMPSQYGGWSYHQHCNGHIGYVDTGEPFEE